MGQQWKQVSHFIFLGSKISADGDCSHEIKRLLLGRKIMINLDNILKSRITWAPRGNHVGPQGKSRGPPGEMTWAPRENHVGQGTLKSLLQHHSSKASILWGSAFFTVQLSRPYVTTGKTIALTRPTLVGKVMSLLLNMLSRLVITFHPRSKHP